MGGETRAIFKGTADDDTIGRDTLNGVPNNTSGNDTLTGLAGIDTLDGDAGNDIVTVGTGDSANGGADNDLFVVRQDGPTSIAGGTGTDTLRVDFDADTIPF